MVTKSNANQLSESEHVISARQVHKKYFNADIAVHAVRGVDLKISKGEFTAIAGPSGSGKTTFLNLISGLDSLSSGTVLLNGRNISAMKGHELSDFRRDNIGFIFQAYNLIPVLNVEENVEYIMMLQGVPREERRHRVSEMLNKMHMKGYLDRFPSQLSGGQQQRVAIARAMVSRPSLILADEPTANLDSTTSASLLDMMRKLNEETGMTFVFSTHDQHVMDKARRLVIFEDGRNVREEQK
ncbi:MAG: ABC transporter ATP-binding protein [Spirochaetota bacterium]